MRRKKDVFSCFLRTGSDGADITSGGRSFQMQAPATRKVFLPTVTRHKKVQCNIHVCISQLW